MKRALPVFGFGAFGQGYDLMMGKHSGLVCQLPAGATQWLATSVTVVHHPSVLFVTFLVTVGTLHYLLSFCIVVDQELQQTVLWWEGITPFNYGWVSTEGAVETAVVGPAS